MNNSFAELIQALQPFRENIIDNWENFKSNLEDLSNIKIEVLGFDIRTPQKSYRRELKEVFARFGYVVEYQGHLVSLKKEV